MERPENYEIGIDLSQGNDLSHVSNGVYLVKIENGESEVYKLPDNENLTTFEENIALRNRIEKAEEVIDILKADLESESKYVDELKNELENERSK